MGEVLPNCNFELIRFGWWDSQIWYVGTSVEINYDSCRQTVPGYPAKQDCGTFFNWNTSAGFKSRHPGRRKFRDGRTARSTSFRRTSTITIISGWVTGVTAKSSIHSKMPRSKAIAVAVAS